MKLHAALLVGNHIVGFGHRLAVAGIDEHLLAARGYTTAILVDALSLSSVIRRPFESNVMACAPLRPTPMPCVRNVEALPPRSILTMALSGKFQKMRLPSGSGTGPSVALNPCLTTSTFVPPLTTPGISGATVSSRRRLRRWNRRRLPLSRGVRLSGERPRHTEDTAG